MKPTLRQPKPIINFTVVGQMVCIVTHINSLSQEQNSTSNMKMVILIIIPSGTATADKDHLQLKVSLRGSKNMTNRVPMGSRQVLNQLGPSKTHVAIIFMETPHTFSFLPLIRLTWELQRWRFTILSGPITSGRRALDTRTRRIGQGKTRLFQ